MPFYGLRWHDRIYGNAHKHVPRCSDCGHWPRWPELKFSWTGRSRVAEPGALFRVVGVGGVVVLVLLVFQVLSLISTVAFIGAGG